MKTVKDLIDILLTMPPDACLVTYHMGNWPDITEIDCTRLGGGENFVELNLVFTEN